MVTSANPRTQGTLHLTRDIDMKSSIQRAFESVLAQLGPMNEGPNGVALNMTLEAWPGGRWFRDLGDSQGHLWGTVQVIKAPTLLEITGPLFMSYAAISHVQYRLEEQGDAVRLTLTHTAIGLIEPAHREGVSHGWDHQLQAIRARAES